MTAVAARRPAGATTTRAVAMLGAVMALESADLAAVGAVGAPLERALHITHTQLGMLAAVSTAVGALATIPAGVLVDRRSRTRLLAGACACWAVAMAAAGAASSFGALLAARAALGALTAVAGPALLSLSGDIFPSETRARSWGLILAGEMAGSGIGFLVSGNLAGIVSWRWAFWALVAPAGILAVALWRLLPEPPRSASAPDGDQDFDRMRLLAALRVVLSVRSNVMLVAAAATANFFFAGVRTFTLVFIRHHYGMSQTVATSVLGVLGVGALVGVVAGGRISDRLLRRGHATARVTVAGVATLAASALWIGPLLTAAAPLGLAVGMLAAAVMNVPNAPMDAARVDVIPPALRGRAESVRALLRGAAFTVAPLIFGVAADGLGGRSGNGVRNAFLVMLVPLAASGALLLTARRPYARDASGRAR